MGSMVPIESYFQDQADIDGLQVQRLVMVEFW